ncbi:MAG: glutamyl-tRNA reductase [Thermoplasmata archaeon]
MSIMSVHATYKYLTLNELEAWTRLDDAFLYHFLTDTEVKEYLILRTCNRLEVYLNVTNAEPVKNKFKSLSKTLGAKVLFLENTDSVIHLMRVCSGIDSMVIGEQDIQRQVKEALETARKDGTSGKVLNYIFMKSLSTGKEVRENTKITNGIISIPQSAIRLLEERSRMQDLKKICVVGYGKVGKTLIKYLSTKNIDLTVCGRDLTKLQNMADEFNIKYVPLKDLKISDYDCIITAVYVTSPIIKFERQGALPRLVIDLGNPRNVEADKNPEYVDLEVLKQFVNKNIESRKLEISKAEKIIEKNIISVSKKLRNFEFDNIISELYKNAEKIRKEEIEETVAKIGANNKEIIENLARSLTNKLLALQTKRIKKVFVEGDHDKIALLKYVFGAEKDVSDNEDEKITRKSDLKKHGD